MLIVPSAEAYYDRFALTSPPIKDLITRLEKEDCESLKRLKEKVIELVLERGSGAVGEVGTKERDGVIQMPSSAYFAYGSKL